MLLSPRDYRGGGGAIPPPSGAPGAERSVKRLRRPRARGRHAPRSRRGGRGFPPLPRASSLGERGSGRAEEGDGLGGSASALSSSPWLEAALRGRKEAESALEEAALAALRRLLADFIAGLHAEEPRGLRAPLWVFDTEKGFWVRRRPTGYRALPFTVTARRARRLSLRLGPGLAGSLKPLPCC